MPAFSIISQDPTIRALVQDGMLERAFHDALFPELMFRGEVEPIEHPGNIGDSQVFTGKGLIPSSATPLPPGADPEPENYPKEQWRMTLGQYGKTTDVYMPNSMVAIADLFLENSQTLGLAAAQGLNRAVRDKLYNAAMSGRTVADGAQSSVSTLRVKRLNGFTQARRPDLAAGSQVAFSPVSSVNPLKIHVLHSGVVTDVNVTGYTPDTTGDEIGPGTLTLDASVTVSDRDPVYSDDVSYSVNVGGGQSIDSISSASTLRLENFRAAVARLKRQNVRKQPSGYFHAHLDPTSVAQIFSDPENQRLFTALPDSMAYQDMALGRMMGTVFYENNECPLSDTVNGGLTNAWDATDPFGGEVQNAAASGSIPIHRVLFVGFGAAKEYYSDLSQLMTEAGVTGKIAEPRITNDGIEVFSERIRFIIRAPLDRMQNKVAISTQFIGDWAVRTDSATGDKARYKRVVEIEHGE